MKFLTLIFQVFYSTYFSGADPNLFGSRKRRRDKQNIANEFKSLADETQGNIDMFKTQNPFETAAAKSAMARVSRNAKEMQTRLLNTLGTNASPEAVIASQGAANEATGSAAGQIAVGAEALKQNQIANEERLKTSQLGMYGQMGSAAADERGSGWSTLFQGIDALGKLASGGGQAASAIMAAGA